MIDFAKNNDNLTEYVKRAYDLYAISLNKPTSVFKEHDKVMSNTLCTNDFYYKFPRNLIFKVTSNCNLRCRHCFFYDNQNCYETTDEMSDVEKSKLIKYFVDEVNIMHCTLTGGEIFTSPIIFDIIKLLKKNNIPLDLLTNGTLLDENKVKILKNILNPNYDIFQISLDGANAETNDLIRGKGNFDKAVNAIKLLKQNNLKVFVALTINRFNVGQLTEIYQLCKDLNVDNLNLGRVIPTHETHNEITATTEEIIINIAKLYDIFDESLKLKIKCLKINDFLEFEEGRRIYDEILKNNNSQSCLHCTPHHDQIAVFPNGNISICYDCDKNQFSIGNLKEKSFVDIWENRHSHPLFHKRLIENSACKKCKYVSLCNTGCIYRALELHGTIDAPGIHCKYFEDVVSKI